MLSTLRNFSLTLFCFAITACYAQGQSSVASPSSKPLTKKEQREAKRKEEAKKKLDYDPKILGYPYFGSEDWVIGTIWYNNVPLQDTPLRYDLVRDEITLPPDDPNAPAHKYRLVSEKVDSFAVHGHTFIRLTEDAGLPDGFYDKLYDGDVQVLARRQKYIYNETTYQRVAQRFLTQDRYYLFKNKNYIKVNGKAAILKVFKDKKKDIENFIRKENLDFKKDFEQDLVKVAAYYDNLRKR